MQMQGLETQSWYVLYVVLVKLFEETSNQIVEDWETVR